MKRYRLFFCIFFVFLVASCSSTVVPGVVESGQASYDGGGRTSGVIAVVDSAEGPSGWVITARARSRYNALVVEYGAVMWTPALDPDYGVTSYSEGCYLMTDEAMSKFIAMAEKARMDGR